MKIGFYMKWPKGSLQWSGNVIGDELYGESMCKSLRTLPTVKSAELYAPNYLPDQSLDVLIYLNDNEPLRDKAKKHVLYLQNAYGEGADVKLKQMYTFGYDGYAFMSYKLLEIHNNSGHQGLFLPFSVDPAVFCPQHPQPQFQYDVSYIGNDIKGKYRTMLYIFPALQYHFGLYGNWALPSKKIWKRWRQPKYQKAFGQIAKGKIPQEEVPVLYSSSKINLNCTAQDCVNWDVITLRTLEILACKGFLITDKVPMAEKLLTGGVVFTDGGADLTAKLEYYLSKPKERQEIAAYGYHYVTEHATVSARMQELVNYLGGII